MRPVWTGSVGFGLVNIPVKLFSAIEPTGLDLDMLDKTDHSRIKYKRVNETSGEEVPWENIVKGYNQDGEYVILEDADFERANAKKTKTIEINDFVNKEEIDSIYYEAPYYVLPDKTGIKAYFLLKEALMQTGKAGVGSFVMRNKEGIAILKATEKVIILQRIHFQEEVRKTDDLEIPESAEIKAQELKMAITLIDQLTAKFDISKYKDTYKDEILKIIKEKSEGVEKPVQKLKVVNKSTQNLMEQLKASLEIKHKKVS
ncbi:MAG TPA: Ku protein [Bacteroidales bacterium]|nr:Ku protein [Bacteroidales bacterium]